MILSALLLTAEVNELQALFRLMPLPAHWASAHHAKHDQPCLTGHSTYSCTAASAHTVCRFPRPNTPPPPGFGRGRGFCRGNPYIQYEHVRPQKASVYHAMHDQLQSTGDRAVHARPQGNPDHSAGAFARASEPLCRTLRDNTTHGNKQDATESHEKSIPAVLLRRTRAKADTAMIWKVFMALDWQCPAQIGKLSPLDKLQPLLRSYELSLADNPWASPRNYSCSPRGP